MADQLFCRFRRFDDVALVVHDQRGDAHAAAGTRFRMGGRVIPDLQILFQLGHARCDLHITIPDIMP